jgi:hypothetical protein
MQTLRKSLQWFMAKTWHLALAIAVFQLSALLMAPTPAVAAIASSCPGQFFVAEGGNIVCKASCPAGTKPTEELPANGLHYAGKFCVAACAFEYSLDNNGTCVQKCPADLKTTSDNKCLVKTELDKFQDTCTGMKAAIRIDSYMIGVTGTLANGSKTTITKTTYVNKNTAGGWVCSPACPQPAMQLKMTTDGDAQCVK